MVPLCLSSLLPSLVVVSRDSSLTEWEREKEMKEFDRLARVHKPLTTALTDRFTKATEQEVCPMGVVYCTVDCVQCIYV